MKLLNYGSMNYDYVYEVDHIVQPGETLAAGSMQIHCGGKGLNQSVALAKAGMEVFHAGMVGEDGDMLLELCRENNIRTCHITRHPAKSGHALIQVNAQGENCILLYEGTNGMNSEAQIDQVLSEFQAGDVLLLQNEINLLETIMEKACKKGMKIILNPSPFNEKIWKCNLSCVSLFLLNEIEGFQMTGQKDPEAVIQVMQKEYPEAEVVLTLGRDGSVYAGKGKVVRCKSVKVEAVDTTAAGDTFTGYFVASLMRGQEIESALHTAAVAAAMAVTVKGAAVSIPVMEEVEKFLSR